MNPAALLTQLRSSAASTAINGFYEGLSRAGQLAPAADPAKYGVMVLRDIPYDASGHPQRRLDIYVPRRLPAPRPTLLYLHGGGFRILSKDTHWIMALAFARRGFLVLNANYRLAPEHPFPAALADASTAYGWVVDHARQYGGDPEKIVVAGESAGANLAASLAIATCFERPEPYAKALFERGLVPRAVLPACGILQVSEPERFLTDEALMPVIADRILAVCRGYLPDTTGDPDRYALANPLSLLESDLAPARPLPPFQAIVGDRDPIREDTRRLGAALAARGSIGEVRTYANQGHAFHAYVWRKEAKQAWRDTFSFLDRHVC